MGSGAKPHCGEQGCGMVTWSRNAERERCWLTERFCLLEEMMLGMAGSSMAGPWSEKGGTESRCKAGILHLTFLGAS